MNTKNLFLTRFLSVVLVLSLGLSLLGTVVMPSRVAQAAGEVRADAVVLVNSASSDYLDFQHFIQPYLDHFGVPYTVLDIAATSVPSTLGEYALIIIGHNQIDAGTTLYLDLTEQGYISTAVSAGSGLVNFDNNLSADGSTGRYTFIQSVFNLGYGGSTSGSGVSFPVTPLHYITDRHAAGSSIGTGTMSLAGVTLPGSVAAIAATGTQPFLAVTSYGSGRGVQWGSYDWMSVSVKGPIYGLDDLVWRSLVWAARKPFVMQGMPPFVTMRSDDESGNFEWIHIANEFGIKPWAGLFFHNIDETEAADLSALVHAGNATASIHAFNGSFFYFNHGGSDYPDATVAEYFAQGTAWHTSHQIPISDFVLGHYYELGTNVFQGLTDWGVEFIGTHMNPGQGYGAPWIMNGPFRSYETGGSSGGLPAYYADYMTIPGHPEYNNQFFNCVTEIRDDAGYEWYPNLSDIPGTIGKGTRQTVRALDSMALATLFTHGYYISGNWGASAPAAWRSILQGITDNISSYEPIYVTMDYACRYIRATHNSNISSSIYDPALKRVRTTLQTVGGIAPDIATKFFVFMDGEGYVMVDAPAFTTPTVVDYTIPGALHHVTVTPNSPSVVAGVTQQFSATGYDVDNNPIPNLSFDWSVVNGGGTINASGLFTAGVVPGSYTNTVVATRNGISGSATVVVTEPVIHHFEFASITSPKYVNAPFSVTIRARDAANNLVVGYAGTASLGVSTGNILPVSTGSFSGGVWSGQVTLDTAGTVISLSASHDGITGTSNTFTVQTAPTCPCSIWDTSTPSATWNPDALELEVGVKFRSGTDGYITALRVYRTASNLTETLPGHLWSSSGTLLGTLSFPAVGAVGWQQVALPAAVRISADTTYIASYHATTGYPVARPYFTEANRSAYERPPLRALVDGEQGGNGVYLYGSNPQFPTSTYQSTNYWVDVLFETEAIPDTTPPTVNLTSPGGGATGISIDADVTATFSEAMNATSIGTASFELRGPSNTLIPAAVTYESATNTARLNPSASLDYATTYTATVKGLPYGVKDLAGNLLAVDFTWSFTTTSAPPSLDHFLISTISSPQTSGVAIPITITARDSAGNLFTGFGGNASLTVSGGTIAPLQTGSFTNGSWSGTVTVTSSIALNGISITATNGLISGTSNTFNLQPPPPMDHFLISTISSPQTSSAAIPITITARDSAGNLFTDYASNASLTVSNGTISPLTTGNFTNGSWSGTVTATSNIALIGISITASNGLVSGTSNTFNLQLPPPPPAYYTVTSPSYEQTVGTAFNVTVTAFAGRTINLWEDAHQDPVLVTTDSVPALNETDGKWTEFLYTLNRPYPTILAGVDEETYGLPTMHFFDSGIPNGTYEVLANLYDNASMRYYYGYSSANPKALNITTLGGATGTQHREYSLGTVTITDGTFNIYVRDADLISGTYAFFGWAHIRLAPVVVSTITINLWEDTHQDPVLATTSDPGQISGTDGKWTEFLYTSSRPYPTILAGVGEYDIPEPNKLPLMRFYSSGIPNGTYEVIANLYDNAPMRYFYGYSADNPKALYVDTPGSAVCKNTTQHCEYSLGTFTITDGNFNIYVRDADLRPSGYEYFGWAWIRLVPNQTATMSSSSGTMLFDGDGDGIFGEPGDNVKTLVNGTFTIPAKEATPDLGITITASDAAARSGYNTYNVLQATPLSLAAGWNLITLPIQPVVPFTAQSLLLGINAQGQSGNCSEIYRWEEGGWDSYLLSVPILPFEIAAGRGYFVYCGQTSTYALRGIPFSSGVSLSLVPGFNLVGLPYPSSGRTAENVLTGITAVGGACTDIHHYVSGGWESHAGSAPMVNDFNIMPAEGYFVGCSSGSSYTP